MSSRFDVLANKLPPMLPPGGSRLWMHETWPLACFAEITLASGNWGADAFVLPVTFLRFATQTD